MCFTVYLASDSPLPTRSFDHQNPRVAVDRIDEASNPVRQHFTARNVYYVHSHQGCGCGFVYGRFAGVEDDPAELALAERSRTELANYLAVASSDGTAIQLYSCWGGDENEPPTRHARITSSELSSRLLEEREFLEVRPAG